MSRVVLATLIVFAFLSMVPPLCRAGEPVLFFSDLIQGPKTGIGDGLGSGVIVTIWGRNLGSSQGTSKVYVGSVEAAYVYEWGNATQQAGHPADLYTYHKMQRVSFSIPAGAVDGANTIKVSVNGVDSNTLPFTVRAGNIRHVKTTGTDNGTCGDWRTPCLTVNYTIANRVSAGDTIYIGDGETMSSYILFRGVTGTSGNYIFVTVYPGATFTLTTASGCVANHNKVNNYIGISKIACKTNGSGIDPFGHLRAVANEITDDVCSDSQAGAFYGQTPVNAGIKLLGNYIHDYGGTCSTSLHHVIYASNRNANPANSEAWEIGWNYLTDNEARAAIHFYDEHQCGGWSGTTKIHDNVVKNQVGVAVDINASCDSGRYLTIEAQIYNNLFINCGQASSDGGNYAAVIDLFHYPNTGPGPDGTAYIYNNTIYGYGRPSGRTGFDSALMAWYLQGYSTSNLYYYWVNNIVVDTNNNPYYDTTAWTPPTGSTNNIWYNGGDGNPVSPPGWDTSPIATNPLFTNAAGGDFSLQSSSPGIDRGSTGVGSVVRTDIDGNQRPMDGNKDGTAQYDIGAYEYAGDVIVDTVRPTEPKNLSLSVCGNGVREGGEECDNGDDDTCPGQCRLDCRCP